MTAELQSSPAKFWRTARSMGFESIGQKGLDQPGQVIRLIVVHHVAGVGHHFNAALGHVF